MHILVGLTVLVGFVAFAFGEQAARTVVRTCLLFIVLAAMAAATYIVTDIVRDMIAVNVGGLVP